MKPAWRSAAAFALLAVGVAAGAKAISSGSPDPAAAPPPPVTFTVSGVALGPPIPAGFVGLSIEYRGLAAYAGDDASTLNPVFLALVRNLAPDQGPVLRIGGDSSDWTWWPVRHSARPPGVKYNLTPAWLQITHEVAQALSARLILGINLEARSRRIAVAEARVFLAGLGRRQIAGLEIGNEPELYGALGWYKSAAGRQIRGRPHGYDFAAFVREFSAIARATPHVPLAGPSSGAPTWISQLGSFLAAEPAVVIATLHRYPLKHCGSTDVTMGQLLSDSSSRGLADGVSQYVTVAHAHHVPLRIDEMNAISCGGQRGVSDVFGSALWAVDALFEMARVGVDGVNFHTVPDTINELIGMSGPGGGWHARVHPEYYGLMLFAQAAPARSRLLRTSSTVGSPIRVWATRATDGTVRVVLINPTTARPATVAVRVPGHGGAATLVRLQAPSVTARDGVTLGGQGFGASTDTGQLAGPARSVRVRSGHGGYVVRMPAASAALLTLPKPPT